MACFHRKLLVLLGTLLVFTLFGGALRGQDAAGAGGDGNAAAETPAAVESDAAEPASDADEEVDGIQGAINTVAGFMVSRVFQPVLFFAVPTGISEPERLQAEGQEQAQVLKTIPLVLLVLILGSIFFTLRFGFINVRLFRHALDVIAGKFDKEDDAGEVTHFQALTSALSATVGLGNIAGVAAAIALGGAGAVFWMWLVGFFGMCAKFSSCTLAQLYRRVKPDGSVLGGPMVYLEDGLADRVPSLAPFGRVLAILYAIFTMCAAFGGGNMFQGNQTFAIISNQFEAVNDDHRWIVGVVLGLMVGAVIIGGIKRIGQVTSKLVPVMCFFYCVVCVLIIFYNVEKVPGVITSIFGQAFQPNAMFGGMAGVLIMGARRAAFSNEAGMGSASIAHAAAKTEEPVREGIVAMIGPFIDTIVVCTMTALAILVTQAHLDAAGNPLPEDVASGRAVEITAAAFANLGTAVPYFLCVAVLVFAYSTMISWCYYGERAIEYLAGEAGIRPYRIVYVGFVILGPILSLQAVLDFSDMMLFSMAFPNIIGSVILSGLVAGKLAHYLGRLKSGEMKPER